MLVKALQGVLPGDSIAEPDDVQEPDGIAEPDSVQESVEVAVTDSVPVEKKVTEAVEIEKKNKSAGKEPVKTREKTPDTNKDAAAEGIRLARNGDYKRAVPLLKQGADNGNATAQNLLGECYQKGNGTSVDYAKAVASYRKATNSGNAEAQYQCRHPVGERGRRRKALPAAAGGAWIPAKEIRDRQV